MSIYLVLQFRFSPRVAHSQDGRCNVDRLNPQLNCDREPSDRSRSDPMVADPNCGRSAAARKVRRNRSSR